MRGNVLVFFPHNPSPPRTGAHKRCLEMLAGLKEMGYAVTLTSSTFSSDTEWENSSIRDLEKTHAAHVNVHRASIIDYTCATLLRRYYQLRKREPPVNSALYTPPGMRLWFRGVSRSVSPDIVVINYAHWDGLLDWSEFSNAVRVIDTLDLLTLNLRMRKALEARLPRRPIRATAVDNDVVDEGFFAALRLEVRPEEFRVYDRYDYTISMSPREAHAIEQHTRKTRVLLIPMTQEPSYISNSYTGPALFPTGPNPFNIQGYLYFVKRVLPAVRKRARSFSLLVTGPCCKDVLPEEGIVLAGYLPDLKTVYESASFVVCPVFGGTGQQVKILEAMAHGVPVVALHAAAFGSPIRHGTNGLVANDADEFADYVVQLWNDRPLCRSLGRAARDTIAAELSRSCLLNGLSVLVEGGERHADNPMTPLNGSAKWKPG